MGPRTMSGSSPSGRTAREVEGGEEAEGERPRAVVGKNTTLLRSLADEKACFSLNSLCVYETFVG